MSLAVILLNWRDEQRTLRCARSVMAWQAPNPHLVVVDNQSTEATRKVLSAALPADSLICSEANLGYGGGNNVGIRRALAAKREYILLLNTDAEISAADVQRLLHRLDNHPEISIIGPVLHEQDGQGARFLVGGRDVARHPSTRIAMPPGRIRGLPGYPLYEVDYVSGTVFLVRGSVLNEIGLLDEQFFFSGEIADFCKRATDRGHKICVDLETQARHAAGETSTQLRETLYMYYGLRNRFLYVEKHHARQKMRYFAYWTMAGALRLLRAVARGEMAKARTILLALKHAYGGHYGNQNASFLYS